MGINQQTQTPNKSVKQQSNKNGAQRQDAGSQQHTQSQDRDKQPQRDPSRET